MIASASEGIGPSPNHQEEFTMHDYTYLDANRASYAVAIDKGWPRAGYCNDDDACTIIISALRAAAHRAGVRPSDVHMLITADTRDGQHPFSNTDVAGVHPAAALMEACRTMDAALLEGQGGQVRILAFTDTDPLVAGFTLEFIHTYDSCAPWKAFISDTVC
jgi:hypothetical protein